MPARAHRTWVLRESALERSFRGPILDRWEGPRMSELSSENSFNKGLQAVLRGQYLEALAYFEASMELVQRAGNGQAPVKYLSYYGLCLAMASARLREAREICERAVEAEFYNPDLYLNLGKVYLKGRDRARAFGALIRGLQLNPRHAGIIREISHLGIR